MNKCPKCGNLLESGTKICSNCNFEIPNDNIAEEIQTESTNITPLDENHKIENDNSKNESSLSDDNSINNTSESNKEKVSQVETAEKEVEQAPATPENEQDETNVVNENLETISVDATNIGLEEQVKEVLVEIPDIPEATIGEINPDLLGNQYDELERINNAKIEEQRLKKLAELEQLRQQEEQRKQALKEMKRPDLLANNESEEININITSYIILDNFLELNTLAIKTLGINNGDIDF